MYDDPNTFQITAKLNQGNSGGPIFTREGNHIALDQPGKWKCTILIVVKHLKKESALLDVDGNVKTIEYGNKKKLSIKKNIFSM